MKKRPQTAETKGKGNPKRRGGKEGKKEKQSGNHDKKKQRKMKGRRERKSR
jgi:hypothetical protein